MAQNFNNIPSTQTLQSSRQMILDRDEAAASNFSGTSFPTSGLIVGMRCHRTDLGKIYALKDLTPTWVEVEDINGASGLAPRATQLATARAFSITGDGSASAINFDGTGAVALAFALATTGVSAGTYTKVTVDTKGRVTAATTLVAGDLPADIAPSTIRLTSGTQANLSSTGHAFQIGVDSALNMVIDYNDIQGRNNGAAGALGINNYGGSVSIGDGSTTTITLGGTIASASLAIATLAESTAGTSGVKLMTPEQTRNAIETGNYALTGGFTSTADDDGTKSSGTYTPVPTAGNFRRIVNGGAFTLAAPTTNGDYTMVIQITNSATAGAITLSGFSKTLGSAFTTTSGHDFFVFITKVNGFTFGNVVALQ